MGGWRWAWEIPHDCISHWEQQSVFFSHLIMIWNTVGNLNAARVLWKLFLFSMSLAAGRSHAGKRPMLTAFTFISCPYTQQQHMMEVRALCLKLCLFPHKNLTTTNSLNPNRIVYWMQKNCTIFFISIFMYQLWDLKTHNIYNTDFL